MGIQIVVYTVQEVADVYAVSVEEVHEWYGENACKLYFASCNGEEGGFAGVKNKDGTYDVCGCRRDEENITFEHMMDVLISEFNK